MRFDAIRMMDNVPLSREVFEPDDCEAVLIGFKGNHSSSNDNCRSKRLQCCNKCQKPVIVFGRLLDCKHAFCETCAQICKAEGCFTCGEGVKEVHLFSIDKGDLSICEYVDVRGVCQRSYMTPDDLLEHQRLRSHLLPPREEDQMLSMINARPLLPRDQGAPSSAAGGAGEGGGYLSLRTLTQRRPSAARHPPYARLLATTTGRPPVTPTQLLTPGEGVGTPGTAFAQWAPRAAGGQDSGRDATW